MLKNLAMRLTFDYDVRPGRVGDHQPNRRNNISEVRPEIQLPPPGSLRVCPWSSEVLTSDFSPTRPALAVMYTNKDLLLHIE